MGRVADNLLLGVRRLLLDSAPVIYSLSVHPEWTPVATQIISECERMGIEMIATPITLSECLAGEADPARQRHTLDFLTGKPAISMKPLDAHDAIVAAALRRETRLKLPDCFQLAACVRHDCDILSSNDKQLSRAPIPARVVLLSELV